MSVTNPAIVVVGFNRPIALNRILTSLSIAHYSDEKITLIISIDKSDTNANILEIANNYQWQFGEKIVNYNSENLGLRKHILQCGDYSIQYGSIIILEDDLYVSPNFYLYAKEALNFSNNKSYIGGVSLYNHLTNVHTREPFKAIDDGYDNYYFQFASSWGQAWTKKQWQEFRTWYDKDQDLTLIEGVPQNVLDWSNKSWLKYFISFLIEKNSFFLYPKIALSTNFSDAGTHISSDDTRFQVPLFLNKKEQYNFATIETSTSVYDAFYENKKLSNLFNINSEDICIDLYGYKNKPKKRYLLSSKKEDLLIIESFAKSLKPLDLNIIFKLNGSDFFLYDTSKFVKNSFKQNRYKKIKYNIKNIAFNDLIYLSLLETKKKAIRLFKRFF